MSRKVKLKKPSPAKTDTHKWCKEAPELFNNVCKYADLFDSACTIPHPGERIDNYQLREMSKFLYFERLVGYTEAIEAFTGIHYFYIRTEDYYGIRANNGDFIYKVLRHPK